MKTSIVYWPKGGSVEKTATAIAETTKTETTLLSRVKTEDIAAAELIIIGGSTVGADHWENSSYKDSWSQFFENLKQTDNILKGKKVAIFGLGNQILYPEHFVDSIKNLADSVKDAGAELVGQVDNVGYDFVSSEALVDGKFLGLPLDEDTQAELSEQRIADWIASIA